MITFIIFNSEIKPCFGNSYENFLDNFYYRVVILPIRNGKEAKIQCRLYPSGNMGAVVWMGIYALYKGQLSWTLILISDQSAFKPTNEYIFNMSLKLCQVFFLFFYGRRILSILFCHRPWNGDIVGKQANAYLTRAPGMYLG
jgi:hypothetical protein